MCRFNFNFVTICNKIQINVTLCNKMTSFHYIANKLKHFLIETEILRTEDA